MIYLKGPLQIIGPSDGSGPQDGGDYTITESDGHIIGIALHRVDWDEYRDAEANARLWAAAPELLKACEIAIDALGCDRLRQDRLEVQKIVNAAIAKAKGEV